MQRIYFDYNATTPLSPAVVHAMTAALSAEWGNPSSVHHFGQQAKAAVDRAREAVARLIGAEPTEVLWTSGGTESDNLALRGVLEALAPSGRRHLVVSGIEHEAVLNTAKAFGKRGWDVSILPVGSTGIVEPEALRAALTDRTALVSVMHANNEIGTIQPIVELARLARERGSLFHTDAVQSAGKIPVDVTALGVDLLSISGHKFSGPKGIGALWIRRGLRLVPQLTGGKHERSRRAGTENVLGIIGMGVAAQEAITQMPGESTRVGALRDHLESSVLTAVPGTLVNGATERRVPNTTNISVDRVEAESLLIALDLEGFAVSTGSACSSGTLEPSHVLRAMGLPAHRTQNSLRFSLGKDSTLEQVNSLVAVLPAVVEKLRRLTRVPVRA